MWKRCRHGLHARSAAQCDVQRHLRRQQRTLRLHALLLGSVHAFDISLVGEGFAPGAVKPTPEKPAPDLVAGCEGDAFLTAGARASMCYAPWVADVDDCVNVAYTTMWLDLSGCQARSEKGSPPRAAMCRKLPIAGAIVPMMLASIRSPPSSK